MGYLTHISYIIQQLKSLHG